MFPARVHAVLHGCYHTQDELNYRWKSNNRSATVGSAVSKTLNNSVQACYGTLKNAKDIGVEY